MVAEVADGTAAVLEALLDDDAESLHGRAGGLGDGDEALQGTAVGEKVVNDQNVLARVQELLGNDHVVLNHLFFHEPKLSNNNLLHNLYQAKLLLVHNL